MVAVTVVEWRLWANSHAAARAAESERWKGDLSRWRELVMLPASKAMRVHLLSLKSWTAPADNRVMNEETPLGRLLKVVSWLASAVFALFVFVLMAGIGWIWVGTFFGTTAGLVGALVIGAASAWAVHRATRRLMFEAALWLHGPEPEVKREMRRRYHQGEL